MKFTELPDEPAPLQRLIEVATDRIDHDPY